MKWPGHSEVAYHASSTPIALPRKTENPAISLTELCKSVIPPCNLNPLLWNGHLQTAWTTLAKDIIPNVYYKRRVFDADEEHFAGSFSVDFVVAKGRKKDVSLPEHTSFCEDGEDISSSDETPMLIALHGMSGGSSEAYVRDVLASLTESGKWAACVLLSRGCAQSKITSRLLYNGRSTWDLRQLVRWLSVQYPNRPLFGLGFSLGANILTNYLGEEGSKCLLKAAIVVSNPWNLELSSWAMRRTWMGSEIYSRAIATGLKEYMESHKDEISKYCSNIDLDRVGKTVYLHEFDEAATAPAGGYPTAAAYYRDGSSADPLLAVRVPLLALNALDDPIVPKECIPFENFRLNPFCVLCSTTKGGHIGWFQSGGARWFTKTITAFLKILVDEVDLGKLPRLDIDVDTSPGGPKYEPTRRKLPFLNQ